MCTLTGTVYNVDGSVAKGGTVNFRLPSTQTFSADSVQTSLEHVVLDSGGNLPAGTQVPLGARIFIQVGNDKPVSVVVTNNPANCPLAFGTLVGSSAGGVPIPSTVITSISTVNNIPGITDTAVNPPGAGPATLTLSDGYPITFGSASSAADLSGTSQSPIFTQVGNGTNGVFLQDETSATTNNTPLGQLVWGSTGTAATEKRAVILDPRLDAASGTNTTGRMDFYLADGSGTIPSPTFQLFNPSDIILSNFTGNKNNGSSVVLSNTNAGTAAQAYYQVSSNVGPLFMGVRSGGYTGADVPAGFGFLESGGGTSGLYLVSDATTGDEGIHFAANGQIGAGNLKMTEDASANFFLTMPNSVVLLNNTNGAAQVEVSNTFAGANSQAEFEVANGNGLVGNFSATGASSTFGAPYTPNMTYIQGLSAAGLLVNSSGAIHLGASGAANVGTLDATEDASNNFFFEPTNTTGLVRFSGGGTTQAVVQMISTGNNNQDYLQIYPQNITQGVGITYNEIHEIGSNGNNSLGIDPQGTGSLNFNSSVPGSGAWAFSSLGTVNNHHVFSALNSGTQPSIATSCNGTGTFAVRNGSTDVAGEVDATSNGTMTNACLINFGAAWAANPICVCSSWTGSNTPQACGTNTSTTQMNLWLGNSQFFTGGNVTWHCTGLVNGASG